MDIKQKIQTLINQTNIKSISSAVKKDEEILNAVKDIQARFNIGSISEALFIIINDTDPVCQFGKKKIFNSFTYGYRQGCGRANECRCTLDLVSQSVTRSKQELSSEQRQTITNKRIETSLAKYGVTNNGQTEKAKTAHKQFYESADNIRKQLQKHQNTMANKYGPGIFNSAQLPAHNIRMTTNNPMFNDGSIQKALDTKQLKYNDDHYLQLSYIQIRDFLSEKQIQFIPDKYQGINYKYEFKCLACNYEWEQMLWRSTTIICKSCHPTKYIFQSSEEDEVLNFIKDLGIQTIQGNISKIGMQLDIICPEQKLAIEYCGLYYHSELDKPNATGRNAKYHLSKLEKVENINWRLITIFSDEWKNKNHVVKSFLTHVLGKTKKTYYARKCKIEEIDAKTHREFLDKYHLQGSCNASIKLGLTYNSELIAVMSFGHLRKALGAMPKDKSYELIRFATNGSSVVGGASRLFTYFISKYSPENVISYSDRRWSTGGLYQKLGFKFVHNAPPSYWYLNGYEKRIHRYNYRKQILVSEGYDIGKTEWEIMQYELGFDRIWDCGTTLWSWSKIEQ